MNPIINDPENPKKNPVEHESLRYRSDENNNTYNAEEAAKLIEAGFELSEVKPYVVGGEVKYFKDDEVERLRQNEIEIEEYKAGDSKERNAEIAENYSKVEYWAKNRNMGAVEIDERFVPKYYGDEQLNRDWETIRRRPAQDRVAVVVGGDPVNVTEQKYGPIEKRYKTQKALREGWYTYEYLDDPKQLQQRNAFYTKKISEQSVGDNKVSEDLVSLEEQIAEKKKAFTFYEKRGMEDAANKALNDLRSLSEKRRVVERDSQGTWEEKISDIEKRTSGYFLSQDQRVVASNIQKMNRYYKELASLEESGSVDAEKKQRITQNIEKIESEVQSSLQKIYESLDEKNEKVTNQVEHYNSAIANVGQDYVNAMRAGDDQSAQMLKRQLDRLKLERVDAEAALDAYNQEKDLFFTMREQGAEAAAEGALEKLGYTGEGVPGETAQEKARNLYAITVLQLEDALKDRFFSGVEIMEGGANVIDAFSTWKMFPSLKGAALRDDEKLAELVATAEALAPLAMLNMQPVVEDKDSAWDVFGKTFMSNQFALTPYKTDQEKGQAVLNSIEMLGISEEDYNKKQFDATKGVASPYEHFSTKDWAMNLSTTSSIMLDIALSEVVTGGGSARSISALRSLVKASPASKIPETARRFDIMRKKVGRGFSNAIWQGAEEGTRFQVSGYLTGQEDELNFASGFVGGLAAAPLQSVFQKEWVKKEGYRRLSGLFGNKTQKAVDEIKRLGTNLRIAGEAAMRGPAELVQEFGEEMGNIYKDSDSWKQFKEKFDESFGNSSDNFHFAVMTMVMGYGMGVGTTLGDYAYARNKEYYSKLTPDEKKKFGEFLTELNSEWAIAFDDAITEEKADPKEPPSDPPAPPAEKKKQTVVDIKDGDDVPTGLEVVAPAGREETEDGVRLFFNDEDLEAAGITPEEVGSPFVPSNIEQGQKKKLEIEKTKSDKQSELEEKIPYIKYHKDRETEGEYEYERKISKEFNKDVRKGLERSIETYEIALEKAIKKGDEENIQWAEEGLSKSKKELEMYDEISSKYDSEIKKKEAELKAIEEQSFESSKKTGIEGKKVSTVEVDEIVSEDDQVKPIKTRSKDGKSSALIEGDAAIEAEQDIESRISKGIEEGMSADDIAIAIDEEYPLYPNERRLFEDYVQQRVDGETELSFSEWRARGFEETQAKKDPAKKKKESSEDERKRLLTEITDSSLSSEQKRIEEEKVQSRFDGMYLDAVDRGEMTPEEAMEKLKAAGRVFSDAYAELKQRVEPPITDKDEVVRVEPGESILKGLSGADVTQNEDGTTGIQRLGSDMVVSETDSGVEIKEMRPAPYMDLTAQNAVANAHMENILRISEAARDNDRSVSIDIDGVVTPENRTDFVDLLRAAGFTVEGNKGTREPGQDLIDITKDDVDVTKTGVKGAKIDGDVKFADGVYVPGEYMVVDASEVIASHDFNGRRNPAHKISDAQPKERSDAASQLQQLRIAAKPRFTEVSKGPDAYSGAPVINSKGQVIQGNNRSLGLKKHYAQRGTSYKAELIEKAADFGLDPDAIAKIPNPVLVRMVDANAMKSVELGNYVQQDIETGSKRRVDAVTLVGKIGGKPKVVNRLISLVFDPAYKTVKQSIKAHEEEIMRLLTPYLSNAELVLFRTSNGLTTTGIDDVANASEQFMFMGEEMPMLRELFVYLPYRAQKGLVKALPKIFSPEGVGLLETIQTAMKNAVSYINSQVDSVDAWANQESMGVRAPKEWLTPLELKLVDMLANERQGKIAQAFEDVATLVKGVDGGMFVDDTVPGISLADAVEKVFGVKITEQDEKAIARSLENSTKGESSKDTGTKDAESQAGEPDSFYGQTEEERVAGRIKHLASQIDNVEGETIKPVTPVDAFKKPLEQAKSAIESMLGDGEGSVTPIQVEEARKAALDAFKYSEWYKGLSKGEKAAATRQFNGMLDESLGAITDVDNNPKKHGYHGGTVVDITPGKDGGQKGMIDQAISKIDESISKLDKFGSETLGINIPVVVAKKVLEAAKLALSAGKTIAEALAAAIAEFKKSNWYKSASPENQKKAEDALKDYLDGKATTNNPWVASSQSTRQAPQQAKPEPTTSTGKKKGDRTAAEQILERAIGKTAESKKTPNLFISRKGPVTVHAKMTKDGSLEITKIQAAPSQRRKGKAVAALESLIEASKASGVPLKAKMTSGDNITGTELQDLFHKAGFEKSRTVGHEMVYEPNPKILGMTMREAAQEVRSIIIEKVNSGSSIEDLKKDIANSPEWSEKSGLSNSQILKIAENAIKDSLGLTGRTKEQKRKMRKHRLYQRVMKLEPLTKEEREAYEESGQQFYEQVKNEDIEAVATETWNEILKDNEGDVRAAYEAYMEVWEQGGASMLLDSATGLSVHVRIMHKVVTAARKAGNPGLYTEVTNKLAKLGTNVGRGIQHFSENAGPDSFVNGAVMAQERVIEEAIGEDKELIEELAKELDALRSEMLEKDVDINQLLEQIAAKDKELADAIEKLNKAQDARNENQQEQSKEATERIKKKKSEPNLKRKDAEKIAGRLRAMATELRAGLRASENSITEETLASALDAAADKILDTLSSLQGMDAAVSNLKSSDEYKNATPEKKREMVKDLTKTLFDNVDGLKSDAEAIQKEFLKANKGSIDWKRLMDEYLRANSSGREAIINQMVDDLGLENREVVDKIREALDNAVKDIVKKKLEDKLRRKLEKMAKVSSKKRNAKLNDLIEAVATGALSNPEVRGLFADVYNFKNITPEFVEKLEQIVEFLMELKGAKNNAAAEVVTKKLRQLLKDNTDYNVVYGGLIQDFMIYSALSGFATQFNAFVGAVSELLPGMIARVAEGFIRNPISPLYAAYKLATSKTWSRAIKSAAAAISANQNDISQHGFYVEGSSQNLGDANKGLFEDLLLEGYKKGQPIMRKIFSTLAQPFRIVHALGGPDVFMNLTASEFLEYMHTYNEQAGQTGKNWVQRLNPKVISDVQKIVNEQMAPEKTIPGWDQYVNDIYEADMQRLKSLGIKPPINYRARLEQSLVEQERESAGVKSHRDAVKDYMLLMDPTGDGAKPYVALQKALSPKESDSNTTAFMRGLFRSIILLPRMMINSTQKVLFGVPLVGMAASFVRYKNMSYNTVVNGKVVEVKMSPKEAAEMLRTDLIHHLTYVGLAVGMASLMFDFEDDDEPEELTEEELLGREVEEKFGKKRGGVYMFGKRVVLSPNRLLDITGELGGYDEDSRSAERGIKPLAIRIRKSPDSEWVNVGQVKYMPSMGALLHMFGTWRDEMVFEDEKDYKDRSLVLDPIGHAMMIGGEMTFAELFRDIKSVAMAPEGDKGKRVSERLAKKHTLLTQPRIYRDLTQTVLSFSDDKRQQALAPNPFLKPYDGYKMAEWMFDNADRVDNFGYSLDYENHVAKLPGANLLVDDYWTQHEKGKRVYELFHKHPDVMAKRIGRSSFNNMPLIKDGKFDDKEKAAMIYAARKLYGAIYDDDEIFNVMNSLPSERFKMGDRIIKSYVISAVSATMVGLMNKNRDQAPFTITELFESRNLQAILNKIGSMDYEDGEVQRFIEQQKQESR